MFLKIICLYVSVVCVFGAPPTDVVPLERQQPTVIPILEQSAELETNGTYKFSYETGNGIKREETSYDKVLPKAKSSDASSNDEDDESNEIHVQQGSYSYTAPDGTVITVRYIADENGFQPIGDHLPKPPSILVGASPSRVSGRKPKTADNAEGGSAPVAAIAVAPAVVAVAPSVASDTPVAPTSSEASKALETPVVKSRIADTSSEEQSSSSAPENQESSTTSEAASSTTEVTSTVEPSTTESASEQQTTTEPLATSEVTTEQPTTTEAASTPAASTSEASSEAASSPEVSSESSTPEEPASTEAASTPNAPAESTPSLEATTEAVTTASA